MGDICPLCGALVRHAERHEQFHDDLGTALLVLAQQTGEFPAVMHQFQKLGLLTFKEPSE